MKTPSCPRGLEATNSDSPQQKLKTLIRDVHKRVHSCVGGPLLRRVESNSSSSSGTPGTPGGSEVASILRPRSAQLLPRGRASRATVTPELPFAVSAMLHAFNCTEPDCQEAKCGELKAILERVEEHVLSRSGPCAQQSVDSTDCKTCRLWRVLHRAARVH